MIDADERALMEEAVLVAVRGAVADSPDAAQGADGADGGVIDAVLEKLGWREMLRDEPDDAIAIVFGALGRTNAVSSALDDVLATALGFEPRDDLAVVLPPFGGWAVPGSATRATRATREKNERGDDDEVHAEGLATVRAAHARELLVVCSTGSALRSIALPVAAAELARIRGVDPDGGLYAVRVRGGSPGFDFRDASLDPSVWSTAVALGRRAIAYQILGGCRTMLDLARRHALEREQFGRPIARFQAVRHRLAEALVAAEALEAALEAARDEPGPETAALAKALAGRSARTVARHAQQVLAGIGFTTEHAFHRTLKRTMALEGLFGSADAIVLDVGRTLLAERDVPTLIEL